MPTYVASDLIAGSTLMGILDSLAGIYDRLKGSLGDATEDLATTLNGAITASASSVVLAAPVSGTWETRLPPIGAIQIEDEKTYYGGVTGNTLSSVQRGAGGTLAVAHGDAATVHLPASAARYARAIGEAVVGNGDTLTGVGESAGWVIRNLFPPFDDQKDLFLWQNALQTLASEYFSGLDQHIAQVAPNVIDQPATTSFGSLSLIDLLSYLRYLNDPDVFGGFPFSLLVPWQTAYLYWLRSGGTVLNPKTVFPPRTILANGVVSSGGVVTITPGDSIPRYGTDDANVWIQGYAAQTIRARVITAGDGTATITANGSGMDALGRYFGRAKQIDVVVAGVETSDTVTINGHPFVATTGTVNPDPNPTDVFACVTTDAATADNLADAINGSTNALIAGILQATSDHINKVTLSPVSSIDSTAYLVSVGAHLTIDAGTQTGLAVATVGGGAGIDPDQTGMGPGADSDVTGTPATQDDLQAFTGILDLSAVGNIVLLQVGGTGNRAMQILSATATTSGVTSVSAFEIESVPERITP